MNLRQFDAIMTESEEKEAGEAKQVLELIRKICEPLKDKPDIDYHPFLDSDDEEKTQNYYSLRKMLVKRQDSKLTEKQFDNAFGLLDKLIRKTNPQLVISFRSESADRFALEVSQGYSKGTAPLGQLNLKPTFAILDKAIEKQSKTKLESSDKTPDSKDTQNRGGPPGGPAF